MPRSHAELCGAALLALCCACATSKPTPPPARTLLETPHEEPELVTSRHTVEPGQTLFRIAKLYGVAVDDLEAANGISDPATLKVGQELVIPVVGAPLPSSAPVVGTPPAPAPKRQGTLEWPLRGVLYGHFGKKGKEPHDGIDLAAPAGTPVKAAADGVVLFAGEQRGYGRIVILEHGAQLVTLYAHNRDLRVRERQKVHSGEVIATVGESGRTSGPHLHFEVRRNGVPVDPLENLVPTTRAVSAAGPAPSDLEPPPPRPPVDSKR